LKAESFHHPPTGQVFCRNVCFEPAQTERRSCVIYKNLGGFRNVAVAARSLPKPVADLTDSTLVVD
jgi:hypothetical protein